MYRQSPSRNQRSKGMKIKHVLQICLLLAVCFWLIYQVKHSHDKKKEFAESDAKALVHEETLGRKVGPRFEEPINKDEKHDEAAEEEEESELEENKHEQRLEEKKALDKEEEGAEGGDEEVDEHEPEKFDTEVDREEDFVDEEKEKEDRDENDTEEKDSEDGNGETEIESHVEHEGDDTEETHEAREENYKADDASSAVTHDAQTTTTENENEHVESSNGPPGNIIEPENNENNSDKTSKSEDRKDLEVEGGEMAKNESQSNEAFDMKENVLVNSENESILNNTITEGSNDHLNTSNSSNENLDLSLRNVTESKSETDHDVGVLTEGMSAEISNATVDADNISFGSNSTEIKGAESNSEEVSNNSSDSSSSSASETVTRSEASEESDAAASVTENNESEKPFIREGTEDGLESETIENSENSEEVQHDSIDISDSSDSIEEKDVRTDLETLPEIQTEGTNSEDVAAE